MQKYRKHETTVSADCEQTKAMTAPDVSPAAICCFRKMGRDLAACVHLNQQTLTAKPCRVQLITAACVTFAFCKLVAHCPLRAFVSSSTLQMQVLR